MQIKDSKDFWSGAMFVGFGLFVTAWSLTHYAFGSTFQVGPGFMPVLIGILLTGIGGAILLRSLAVGTGGPRAKFQLRPLVLLPVSAVAYGYLLQPLGLVVATVILVVVARLAGREPGWREPLLLGLALAAFSFVAFVYALAIPIPVWPTIFGR